MTTATMVLPCRRRRAPSTPVGVLVVKKARQRPRRVVDIHVFRSVILAEDLVALITSFQHGLFADLVPYDLEWRTIARRRRGTAPLVLPERFFHAYGKKAIDLAFLCLDGSSQAYMALHLAIFEGDIARVRQWLACKPHWLTARAFDCAAFHGHMHIVQYLHSRGAMATSSAMDLASFAGHLAMVEFLHRTRREGCTFRALDDAAAAGHLDLVRFLHQHTQGGATVGALDGAAARGFLDVVTFLHHHRTEGCTTSAMDAAATNGHLEVVRFLHYNRHDRCTHAAMDGAATNGHLHVVEFLHTHRTEGCSTAAFDGAARRGHLDVVRWLHAHRTEGCTTDAMDDAATNGHLAVVQWLHATRCEGGTDAGLREAKDRGHDAVATFLQTHCQATWSVPRYIAPPFRRALWAFAQEGFPDNSEDEDDHQGAWGVDGLDDTGGRGRRQLYLAADYDT